MTTMKLASLIPGVALTAAVALAAVAIQAIETKVAGRPYLEALVIAILLGTAVRSMWTPGPRWTPGISFSSKFLLELAVMLLGASISYQALRTAGLDLIAGIAILVCVAILASYALCRLLALPRRMAILVACGNSICGNSAIAAVAPVIRATPADVASSIAFTAILGVVVVLTLPLLIPLLRLTDSQYGVLAGLTVYAVPQVLAATVPIGALSTQLGTLVKLVRVLMLGPLVVMLSLVARHLDADEDSTLARSQAGRTHPPLHRLVPWFIVGFLILALLRSLELLPEPMLAPTLAFANVLTVVAMAALGLGVDLRVLATVSGRVTAAVTASLLFLLALSLGLIRLMNVA